MDAEPKFSPIRLHDQILGWLVLHPGERLPRPGKDNFFRDKSEIFYTVGIIVFILAGLVSYGLSRYILSPINKLMAGTMALMDFKFDTRIEVVTKDELGPLAQDFNRMAKTLEAYEALKKQWVVDISHELRTPLSV